MKKLRVGPVSFTYFSHHKVVFVGLHLGRLRGHLQYEFDPSRRG